MQRLFLLPWLLLLGGALLGSVTGAGADRPVQVRGGYRVLEGDFHVHTRFSDGFLSAVDVGFYARGQGLDVLGVTEHNSVLPAKVARWTAARVGGPIVVVGEEVTTRDYHLIALGLGETVPGGLPVEEAIARVHAQGGLAIAAHPVKHFWTVFEPVRAELDGSEVMHPIAYREGGGGGWRWQDLADFYGQLVAAKPGRRPAAIGSSDYHGFNVLGLCRTLIFVEEASEAGVLAAIRAGRTVVEARSGQRFGDPAMIELLDRAPLPSPAAIPSYAATGRLDLLSRVLVWVGLLGAILLRRRGEA